MKHALLTCAVALIVALAVPAYAQKTAGNMLDDSTVNASVKAALFGNKETPSAR